MSIVRSTHTPVRILYAGLPLGALALVHAGLPPVAALVGHPDAPGMRRLRCAAAAHGMLLLGRPDPKSVAIAHALRSLRPDALLSWFWPRKLPASLLGDMPLGAYGVHPSLLPRHRGPDPYFWALYRGDAHTGVTLHALDESYDTGPLVAQARVAIASGDDAWSLARRLDRPGLRLLVEAARALQRREPLHGAAQDPATATRAPQPSEAILAIDWRRNTGAIERLVRAAAPWPGASAVVGATPLRVLRARPVAMSPLLGTLRLGEAVVERGGRKAASDASCVVRAADGGLRLLRARREDDDRELDAAAIAALLVTPPDDTPGTSPTQSG